MNASVGFNNYIGTSFQLKVLVNRVVKNKIFSLKILYNEKSRIISLSIVQNKPGIHIFREAET